MTLKINFIKVLFESLFRLEEFSAKDSLSSTEMLEKIDDDLNVNLIIFQMFLNEEDKYLNYYVAKFKYIYKKYYNKKSLFYIPKHKLNSLAIINLYLIKEAIINDDFDMIYEANKNIDTKNYEKIKYILERAVFTL